MGLGDKIKELYPQLVNEDYTISIGCGKGWHPIILEVCKRIQYSGTRFAQVKEKFGTLRIYMDFYTDGRIALDKIVGMKDGKEVDYKEPDAEVWIRFYDNKDYDLEGSGAKQYHYNPKLDKFYDQDGVEVGGIFDADFVRGRLAQLTGLVDAEPIEEEPVDDVIEWAEKESVKTCEGCGTKEGVTSEGGWIKTLCPTCRNKKNWYDDEED